MVEPRCGRAQSAVLYSVLFSTFLLGSMLASVVQAATTTVTAFAPYSATPANGVWYEISIVGAGTASTVDLTGVGGNLENNQPLPVGAGLLTTSTDTADVAHVGVVDTYGNAGSILTDSALQISYAFHKASAGDLNIYVAPEIRLTLNNPSAVGDGNGRLTYAPVYQSTPFIEPITPDQWITATITSTSGLFWWDGGLGQPNSFGGGPYRTLADWAAAFGGDFAGADLLALSVGVGSGTPGQTGYFDDVAIAYTGYDERYNFEPIPEPSTAWLLLMGLVGLVFSGRSGSI